MKRLPDKRVSYFWDGKGELSKGYSRVLKLPGGQSAWDVYLVFNRDVEWKIKPPVPDYWMHQLNAQPQYRLNAVKFGEETKKLLQNKK